MTVRFRRNMFGLFKMIDFSKCLCIRMVYNICKTCKIVTEKNFDIFET
jgi:uncharacterized protein YjaG (DUF416 family)